MDLYIDGVHMALDIFRFAAFFIFDFEDVGINIEN